MLLTILLAFDCALNCALLSFTALSLSPFGLFLLASAFSFADTPPSFSR